MPLCADVSSHHSKQLQLDVLFAYDEEVLAPADAPTPLGDVARVVETMAGVCAELHPRIAEFFTTIVREDLLNLEQRPNKTQSAGCMFIADRRLPFILASYGGYPHDVDVIVHEFGHGFHQFAAKDQPLLNYALADGDLAELCAMGMTIITLPYVSRFYVERHPTLSRSVLWTLVRLMPFVTLLDAFEHEVFAGTPPSADDCNQLWLKLEQQYMPWRRYGATMPHLSAGASWQLYAHTEPFHSIGYAIAAAAALQLLPRVRANHAAAVEAYIKLCTAGASKEVQELLPLAGLASPFDPDTIAQLAADLRAELIEPAANPPTAVD